VNVNFVQTPAQQARHRAEERLSVAVNALGQAKDALELLGANERAVELRRIMLKLGTIIASV